MSQTYRFLWLIIAHRVLLCSLFAQDTTPLGIRLPPSLNFTISPNPVGSGARAVGWGTAFIADATAASHNPAGLVQFEHPESSIVGSYFLRHEQQNTTEAETIVEDQNPDNFELNYLSIVYPFELWSRNILSSRIFCLN
ncbi:MAG: hypothetical protein ETSY2_25435 [Candidatus Entotheonella gemina]|uniref:PorV/PorQ family protein n=1 Tax=Candidatus Entotheonella gemina TaxID=1429439 RepID=W4M496_9BACT|nr:MAG: hypothetical protein ETSY2_25435 [Candidatus Entotheonella gemina]